MLIVIVPLEYACAALPTPVKAPLSPEPTVVLAGRNDGGGEGLDTGAGVIEDPSPPDTRITVPEPEPCPAL